jgi:hypothetical protein
VIWFLWAKYLSATEIHRRLIEAYGDGSVREQRIRKWRRDFENNRKDIHDDCTGRFRTRMTAVNAARMVELILGR